MKAVFRADASSEIGGGHVMRCLTLADELHAHGWSCVFLVSRQTPAAAPALERSAHRVEVLAGDEDASAQALKATQSGDVDLLVVDHYGLDAAYEMAWRKAARVIVAIDDLADRKHDCDVLLDQTYGRAPGEYAPWVGQDCRVLTGSEYALLRPQFSRLRTSALARRAEANGVRNIVVSIGMTDPSNHTHHALRGIEASGLDASVDVILGSGAPFLAQVREQATAMAQTVRVHVDVDDVATLLAAGDIAIGAGGSASWERCCLGLASIVVVLADNQRRVADELASLGAIALMDLDAFKDAAILGSRLKTLAGDDARLAELSRTAATVCDGQGVWRLMAEIGQVTDGVKQT